MREQCNELQNELKKMETTLQLLEDPNQRADLLSKLAEVYEDPTAEFNEQLDMVRTRIANLNNLIANS
jgi:predicted DNA-binding protein YlxM (UPF0122 family)